jgi:hypothetical protein
MGFEDSEPSEWRIVEQRGSFIGEISLQKFTSVRMPKIDQTITHLVVDKCCSSCQWVSRGGASLQGQKTTLADDIQEGHQTGKKLEEESTGRPR